MNNSAHYAIDLALPEHLKPLAKEFAQALVSNDGVIVAPHLTRMLEAATAQPAPANGNALQAPVGRVGIWQRTSRGDFSRNPSLWQRWSYWANVSKIPVKGARKRVVLLGESVARGFLYDPLFNVAKVLEQTLNATVDGIELVDLACTNQTLPELKQLLQECSELSPDALVIFAGNNWSSVGTDSGALDGAHRSALLSQHGATGLRALYETNIAREVRTLVAQIGELRERTNVPVVFVIPEFNLLDWRDARPMAPHLPARGNIEWLRERDAANEASACDDVEELFRASKRMIELDGGTTSWAFRMAAEARVRSKAFDEARELLQQSRDAELWDHSPHTPRCYAVVQRVLRESLHAHSIPAVDLPKLFADCFPGELPGRRLFIDYCHLSAEGIRHCCAFIAAELVRLLSRGTSSASDFLSVNLQIDPRVEAQAHFAAAIHNAHWGYDCNEIVEHHCRRALEREPSIADQMRRYIDLMTRKAPGWMCSSTSALANAAANPAMARYVIGMLPRQLRTLDEALLPTLARLTNFTAEMLELRIREHARRGTTVDLLESLHSLHSLSQREALWLSPGARLSSPDYYRAFSDCSSFYFFEELPEDCAIRLTGRLPGESNGTVAIEINGTAVANVPLGRAWTKVCIDVSAQVLCRGLNTIMIRWPHPNVAYETVMACAAASATRRVGVELFPVFGELHTFTCGTRDDDDARR